MMNKIKDAEHLQTIAEMRQKIAELEIEVRMQAYVCRLMYAGLCMQAYVCRYMYAGLCITVCEDECIK